MGAQFCVMSATITGVEASLVEVEVAVSRGLPGMTLVGMPDAAVRESLERVRSALRACGFTVPGDKVVINLAPSSMRKNGSGFDLPIAVALLAATGQIPTAGLKECLWVGELSLEGEVRPVRGTLAYALAARESGLDLVASSASPDSVPIEWLRQWGVGSLANLRLGLTERLACSGGQPQKTRIPDFASIRGQDVAKRALLVSAAGKHGILLSGPPGSGKTMLAQALPGILPPMTQEETYEAAMIHSVAGEPVDDILRGRPPFRAVHHSATMAGLVGGGTPVRPGAVSLAHQGVLFLDELAEFSSRALQALRQPLEQGFVNLSRAEGNISMPARFMLVAATNPCPCGFYGDPEKPCTCSPAKVAQYQDRIGGPLLDRIDIHVDVWRCDVSQLTSADATTCASSDDMRDEVCAARDFAAWREGHLGDGRGSSLAELLQRCRMSTEVREELEGVARSLVLSGRGVTRVLGVARTIADLDASTGVQRHHVMEALALRVRQR